MGYTTIFTGELKMNKKISVELMNYINRFSSTRRMQRDVEKIKEVYPNWKDLCYNGELGNQGEFFAPISNNFGQERSVDIIEYNYPPNTQPGLWCQWIINPKDKIAENTTEVEAVLEWDKGEKFYDYVEWLEYMIKNFFIPNDIVLNGVITAVGEEYGDAKYIVVVDNKVDEWDYTLDIASICEREYATRHDIADELLTASKNFDEDDAWDYDDED